MKFNSIIFILSPFFLFTSCSREKKTEEAVVKQDTVQKKNVIKEDDLETRAVNAVMALPEVEQASHYIDSISNHQHGAAAIYDGKEEGSKDVGVRVGYNGEERFEVYYFFYVDTASLQIKIQDIVNDTILPIEEWRKNKGAVN